MTKWSIEFKFKVGEKIFGGIYRGDDFESMPIIFSGGSSDQSFVKYLNVMMLAIFRTFLELKGIEEKEYFKTHTRENFSINLRG